MSEADFDAVISVNLKVCVTQHARAQRPACTVVPSPRPCHGGRQTAMSGRHRPGMLHSSATHQCAQSNTAMLSRRRRCGSEGPRDPCTVCMLACTLCCAGGFPLLFYFFYHAGMPHNEHSWVGDRVTQCWAAPPTGCSAACAASAVAGCVLVVSGSSQADGGPGERAGAALLHVAKECMRLSLLAYPLVPLDGPRFTMCHCVIQQP